MMAAEFHDNKGHISEDFYTSWKAGKYVYQLFPFQYCLLKYVSCFLGELINTHPQMYMAAHPGARHSAGNCSEIVNYNVKNWLL